ncbi:MAG: hypothetical protein P4M11_08620, partial [Candidatus Pacebacteria bacterium]|nr:hypothetical protein [Candidatus Paceibacterota bacterium]
PAGHVTRTAGPGHGLSTLSRVLNRNENPNPNSLATRFCDANSPKWSCSQPFENYQYVFYGFF